MRPKPLLTTLTLIHTSFCVGLAIFTGFAFYFNNSLSAAFESNDIFVYVVPIIAMAGYFSSKFIYQNLIENIPSKEPLSNKLSRYQAAAILKYALLELPSFLALFAYYFNGNAMHLVIALTLLAYLFFQRPSLAKLKAELPLSLEEEKEFDTLNR